MEKNLTAHKLKLIAIIAMLSDHLSYIAVYLPGNSFFIKLIPVLMTAFGRLTMPIMCFFIAEGYYHTRNLKKYFLRLFIFGIISQLPYAFFSSGPFPSDIVLFIKQNLTHLNVMATLFMGLCALTLAKAKNVNIILKLLGIFALVYISSYSDWRYFGVLWILGFGLFRGNFLRQGLWFSFFAVMRASIFFADDAISFAVQLCTLIALFLLDRYNGEEGRKSGLMFYIFYPLHLLVIAVIKYIIVF